MEIIEIIGTICPIAVIVAGICICYHKAKQENDKKIELAISRNKIISDYCEDICEDIDNAPRLILPTYREYKAMGGNGYLTQLYTPTEYKPKHISPHTHNCINCGAPLRKDRHKCEYCGTEYFYGGEKTEC